MSPLASPHRLSDRVLIVEDDPKIANLITLHLTDLGYEVDRADDGPQGIDLFRQQPYALVILDVMLPSLDGLEVCKRIRAVNTYTPILMLTVRSDELDVVLGLEVGADDYLTKPFSVRELIARIKALFRRMEADHERAVRPAADAVMTIGELTLEPAKRKVRLQNRPVDLTAKEFDLLELLAANPGCVYSRTDLLEQVWGYRFDGYEHTVNSLISRLRHKIEADPSRPIYIKTVWGVGYRFVEQDEIRSA